MGSSSSAVSTGGGGVVGNAKGNPTIGRIQSTSQQQTLTTTTTSAKHPPGHGIASGPGIGGGGGVGPQHQRQTLGKPQLQQQQHQSYNLSQYQSESQHQRQQQHQQHQRLLDKNLVSNTGLPPRYQPPPQPQQVSGILKNIVGQQQQPQSSSDTVDHVTGEFKPHTQSQSTNTQKNPALGSEIEVESNLYLTGSKSLTNLSSRIVPPKRQLRPSTGEQVTTTSNGHRNDIQVQIHPPPRIPSSTALHNKPPAPPTLSLPPQKSIEEELNFLQRQQQLQHHHQQQEMLKFVRKTDSGQPSPSSSGGGSASGRMPTDQNRHLQVRRRESLGYG